MDGHKRPNRMRITQARNFYVNYGKTVENALMLAVPLLGVETVLRLERNAGSTVK